MVESVCQTIRKEKNSLQKKLIAKACILVQVYEFAKINLHIMSWKDSVFCEANSSSIATCSNQ